jgi:hypothetical protein
MALQVIGAGMGRTSTHSLKLAQTSWRSPSRDRSCWTHLARTDLFRRGWSAPTRDLTAHDQLDRGLEPGFGGIAPVHHPRRHPLGPESLRLDQSDHFREQRGGVTAADE